MHHTSISLVRSLHICALCCASCAIVPDIASCGPSDRVLNSFFFSPLTGTSQRENASVCGTAGGGSEPVSASRTRPRSTGDEFRLLSHFFFCFLLFLLVSSLQLSLGNPFTPVQPQPPDTNFKHRTASNTAIGLLRNRSVGAETCLAMRKSTDLELRSCLMLQEASWKPTSSQQPASTCGGVSSHTCRTYMRTGVVIGLRHGRTERFPNDDLGMKTPRGISDARVGMEKV